MIFEMEWGWGITGVFMGSFLALTHLLTQIKRAMVPGLGLTFRGGFQMKIFTSSVCSFLMGVLVISSLGCMVRTRNGEVVGVGIIAHDERWHYDHDHDDNWRHDHPWHGVALVVVHDERWHYDNDHNDDWRRDHPWHDRNDDK